MAGDIRLGSFRVDHFADHLGNLDRVYLGNDQIYPIPPPSITLVEPSTSTQLGGVIAIQGTNFIGTTVVKFDGVEIATTVYSETLLGAIVPGNTPGDHAITVTTPSGTSAPKSFTTFLRISQGVLKNGTQTPARGASEAAAVQIIDWSVDPAYPDSLSNTAGLLVKGRINAARIEAKMTMNVVAGSTYWRRLFLRLDGVTIGSFEVSTASNPKEMPIVVPNVDLLDGQQLSLHAAIDAGTASNRVVASANITINP